MSTQPTTKKAIAYITKNDQLMVFTHTDFPEAGVQVPAGTVEDNRPLAKVLFALLSGKGERLKGKGKFYPFSL